MTYALVQDFSDETLEHTPVDVTQFLAGVGAVAEIRTTMGAAGMEDEDIIEGRSLLLECLAAPRTSTVTDTPEAQNQRTATAELDSWDDDNFPRQKAALARRYPAACDYVFYQLAPAQGAASVQAVATLLMRVEALDSGSDPARSASRKEDKKAVELLAKRGLDPAERKRLKKLVEVALDPTSMLDPSAAVSPQDDERRKALLKLKLWYNEWATVAHSRIKKRSHLIRLGLANRRAPQKDDSTLPGVPAVGTAQVSPK